MKTPPEPPKVSTVIIDGCYSPEQRSRHSWLVKFHQARGWMNCSHKTLERLEAEFEAMTVRNAGDRSGL